ncbi:hypothetical protein CP08DC60_1344, partial [Chlamydia psittaci 08DC60]
MIGLNRTQTGTEKTGSNRTETGFYRLKPDSNPSRPAQTCFDR